MYHYGTFRTIDVEMTSLALMAFSFALLGWSLIKVLAPGYYARQDTKGPVKVALRALGLTMALNVLVLIALAMTGHLNTPGAHALLALTNGVGAIANAAMLYVGLKRKQLLQPDAQLRSMILKIVAASALMGGPLWWFGGETAAWIDASIPHRVVWLTALVGGGAIVYFGALFALGARVRHFRMLAPAVGK